MNQSEFKKKYGYEVVHNKEKNTYSIIDTPLYPQSSNKIRKLFTDIERASLFEGGAMFPNKVKFSNIEIEGDFVSMYMDFHFDGMHQLLKDENLNPLLLTFFKPEIYYPKRSSKLPNLIINIYQFDNNGLFEFEDEFEFLDFSFINYNKKQFTKKRLEIMKEMGLKIEEITQIPAIPLLLVKFDNTGIVEPFEYLERAKGKKLEEIISPKHYH